MKRMRKLLPVIILAVLFVSVGLPEIDTYADGIVYTTATGTKYHYRRNCRGLNRARAIYETTLSNAQSQGLTACAICAHGVPASTGGGSAQTSSEDTKSVVIAETETAAVVETISLAKGDTFDEGGIKYKVTSVDGNTVKVIGHTKDFKKITIPQKVKKNEEQYTVTAIGEGSFRNMSSATSLNIASSVQKIGKNVFANCSNLKSISISMDGTQSIGSGAFSGISSGAKIKIRTSQTDVALYQAFVKKLSKAGASDAICTQVAE